VPLGIIYVLKNEKQPFFPPTTYEKTDMFIKKPMNYFFLLRQVRDVPLIFSKNRYIIVVIQILLPMTFEISSIKKEA